MKARFVAFLAALLIAVPVAAQEQRGAIEGVVKDASGAVLPGVTVEARGNAGAQQSVTDTNGHYRFPSLVPGRYTVVATLQGFNEATLSDVQLSLGQTLRADVTMSLAGVSETVQVSAERPIVDVKSAASNTNVDREYIDNIPKARNAINIATLAPGSNQEPKGGGINIDGASGSENRYFIDGVDTTNMRTGTSGKGILSEFVEEVQVKSSGYPAEFGGATGGVINVITRSGTNNFSGEFGSYFNGSSLNGDRRPTLRLLLSGVNEAEYVTFPNDDYSLIEPFANIGGPILRDRLWFFGGYTPQMENTERTVTFRSNNQTGTYEQKETNHYFTGTLTGVVTQQLRGRFSANIQRYERDGVLPALGGTGSPTANYTTGQKRPNDSMRGSLDYTASNNLFFSGAVNYYKEDTVDVGIPSDLWYTFASGNSNIPGITSDLVRSSGFNSLSTNRASVRDIFERLGGNFDATAFFNAKGSHTLKGGVQFYRITNDVFNAEQAPHITLDWNASRTTLDGRSVRGQYGYYSYRQFGTQGVVNVNNLGFFIQDDWTINDRLTLNLGIRTDRDDAPSYVEGLDGITFDFSEKIAPRVGFAYDVRGDGRWKAYGSWGMFYDLFKLEMPRGAFGGDKWIEYYYPLDTLNWPSIGVNGNFPGQLIEQVNYRIPSNDPSCPECGGIDPDLKPMRSQELVFGLDHELNSLMSVGARYVHKQLDRTIEDVGVVVPNLGEVYFMANPGEGIARHIIGEEFPSVPKPVRDYDALELRFTKRHSNNWSLNTSLTFSRLYGNYSGLASSDENGRTSPNVNRFFDGINMMFDSNAEPVYGRLATDRPVQFKANGYYTMPWGTNVGAVFYAMSGTPISRQANMVSSLPVLYMGRGSDGRLPVYSQTDLQLQQSFGIGGNRRIELSINVLNLFDQSTAVNRFAALTRDNINITDSQFFAGFDMEQLLAARPNIRRDPRFLQDNQFQDPRAIRVGAKFVF
jgi:outer membrane receptor protein involved in Fe transport